MRAPWFSRGCLLTTPKRATSRLSIRTLASVFLIAGLVPLGAQSLQPDDALAEAKWNALEAGEALYEAAKDASAQYVIDTPTGQILSQHPGTTGAAEILLVNAPTNSGGFSLYNPDGDLTYANGVTDSDGRLSMYPIMCKVSATASWSYGYKPTLPRFAPEDPEQDIGFDLGAHAFMVLGYLPGNLMGQVSPVEMCGATVTPDTGRGSSVPNGSEPLPEEDKDPDTDCSWYYGTGYRGGKAKYVTSHLKWVPTFIVHSPNPGTASMVATVTTTTTKFFFNTHSESSSTDGITISTDNGQTLGYYQLRMVDFYDWIIWYWDNDEKPKGWYRLNNCSHAIIKEDHKQDKSVELFGPSLSTDADDIKDFWKKEATGVNVKAFSVEHQWAENDKMLTTASVGKVCHQTSGKKLYGMEFAASFSYGAKGVSIPGKMGLKHQGGKSWAYEACFGNNATFYIDNFEGNDHDVLAAYRTA